MHFSIDVDRRAAADCKRTLIQDSIKQNCVIENSVAILFDWSILELIAKFRGCLAYGCQPLVNSRL